MKIRRVLFWFGGSVAVILGVLLTGALWLPRFVDSQRVKTRIAALVTENMRGSMALGRIELFWLPRPAATIDGVDVVFEGETAATIRKVTFYPSILALLTGRLVARRALLEEPRFTIHLAERAEKPLTVEELEREMRAAVSHLTNQFPVSRIDVANGSATIQLSGRTPLTIEGLSGELIASSKEVRLRASAGSNLGDRVRVAGKIEAEDLAGELKIAMDEIELKPALALWPSALVEYVKGGKASFTVEVATLGLKKIKAAVDGSAGSLVLGRGDATVNVNAKGLKGNLVYDSESILARLERFELISPQLTASGELKIDEDSASMRLRLGELDIAEMRAAALGLAKDSAQVNRLFQFVQAGSVSELTLQSDGGSLAQLTNLENIVVSGVMRNGTVSIPKAGLDLKKVNGSMRLARGVLEATDVALDLDTGRAWGGKLKLGLDGKTGPFQLDISLRAGAAEIQSKLMKLVENEALRRELAKVRNLKGSLSGRLALGDRLEAIFPIVSISQAELSASYDPVPFPIVIKGGQFSYNGQTITAENLHGSVGESTFAGLHATWHNDAARRITIASGPMALELKQAALLLRSLGDGDSLMGKLALDRGQMEFSKFTLEGPYNDPARWKFSGVGRIKGALVSHTELPGPLSITRADFTASEAKIDFSKVALSVRDASASGGGTFEAAKGTPFKLRASGTGVVGPQMTGWISRQVELPNELALRAPLKIGAENFSWRPADEVAFRGKVTTAGGAQIALDLVRIPQRLTLRDLTIDDGVQRARMTFQQDRDDVGFSFKGNLAQQTLDRIFVSLPLKNSALRGDIRASAAMTKPFRFTAHGQLEGTNVWLPWDEERVLIDQFRIQADKDTVQIRTADLRWRGSGVAISGNIAAGKEAMRFNLDASADQLSWTELTRTFETRDRERGNHAGASLSFPPARGTIRLRADSFQFERFNLTPLHATVIVSPPGLVADIHRAEFCGIRTIGRVEVLDRNAGVGLDLQFSATDAELGPASVCLTDRRNHVTGTYSLTAKVSGRGGGEELLKTLAGNFQFNARDGEFVRSAGIDAAFDYLNATGDFKMAFPDLERESLPYRLMSVNGRLADAQLWADEVNVQGALINLSGQGRVDLERKDIDGKGIVAVLKPVDDVLSRIPVIGSMFGDSLLGIPVRVAGSLERPDVSYLAPADVGAELLNIPLRILGLPLGAMKIFTPGQANGIRDN